MHSHSTQFNFKQFEIKLYTMTMHTLFVISLVLYTLKSTFNLLEEIKEICGRSDPCFIPCPRFQDANLRMMFYSIFTSGTSPCQKK